MHGLLGEAFFTVIAALLRKPKLLLATLSSALAKNNEVQRSRQQRKLDSYCERVTKSGICF